MELGICKLGMNNDRARSGAELKQVTFGEPLTRLDPYVGDPETR